MLKFLFIHETFIYENGILATLGTRGWNFDDFRDKRLGFCPLGSTGWDTDEEEERLILSQSQAFRYYIRLIGCFEIFDQRKRMYRDF